MEILVKDDRLYATCTQSCVQGEGVSKQNFCSTVTTNGMTYKYVDGIQSPICYIQPCNFKPCYSYLG